MVDQINQSIDVVVPLMDGEHEHEYKQEEEEEEEEGGGGEDDNENKMIFDISENKVNRRPLYQIRQKRHFHLIREQLKMKNRILWKAYNTHAYYSCDTTEMKQKILEHMINTRAYSFIMDFNETTRRRSQKIMNNMLKWIKRTLNTLLYYQLITYLQMQRMIVDRHEIRFQYLYYLPDIHMENVPFRPIMTCHRGATIHISRFLTHLLQPIYNGATHSKTFITGVDAVNAIEAYTKKGLLRSNTLFATLHINDLCTIFPHEQSMQTLQRFLHEYVLDGHIEGMTIQTIMDLVRLILRNQYFLYNNKLYQQIQGGASGSPITYILANIYLYYWQQDLVKILDDKNEIFGRCFDQIFLTWNESEDNLRTTLLNTIQRPHSHIQTKLLISQNIIYLDAQIGHIDGDLNTNVAHDLDIEPHTLPFIYGHPRNNYSILIRGALLRATGCCSHVFEFHNERQHIELSFSLNGFSSDFIKKKVQLFFIEFNAIELEFEYDQTHYDQLRQRVFNYNQQKRLSHMAQF